MWGPQPSPNLCGILRGLVLIPWLHSFLCDGKYTLFPYICRFWPFGQAPHLVLPDAETQASPLARGLEGLSWPFSRTLLRFCVIKQLPVINSALSSPFPKWGKKSPVWRRKFAGIPSKLYYRDSWRGGAFDTGWALDTQRGTGNLSQSETRVTLQQKQIMTSSRPW